MSFHCVSLHDNVYYMIELWDRLRKKQSQEVQDTGRMPIGWNH